MVRRLLQMTSDRAGLGDLLAEGSLRFGRHFGAEDQAVQVNGLELAYHDPRGVSGMALSYATSPRGACHNQSDYFKVDWGDAIPEIGIDFIDRHAGAEKAANVMHHQDWRTIFNSLTVCIFATVAPDKLAALVNADKDLGTKLGINHTPTIYVVSNKRAGKPFVEVVDRSQLFALIDSMKKE